VNVRIPVVFITRIEEQPGIDLAKIEAVCHDIAKKDSTFHFTVFSDAIEIKSGTRDQAFRRGSWFKKVDDRILYKVFYRKYGGDEHEHIPDVT